MDTKKNVCPICGNEMDEECPVSWNGEEAYVCRDCAHDLGYEQCEDCGAWVRECDGYTVNSWTNGECFVCDDCITDYYRCDDCHDYFSARYVHTDNFGHVVCDSCYDEDYITCEQCGVITRHWDETEDGDYLCSDCYEEYAERSRCLHPYSHKPNPIFGFTPEEVAQSTASNTSPLDSFLTLGVENEVDDGENAYTLCQELTNLGLPIYMKRDGSLCDEGVEIVTHPASLRFHMEHMGWDRIVKVCTANGYKSHNTSTCGLHVHIGRRGLGADSDSRATATANLVILVNTLWNDLVTFSRRKAGPLERWAARPDYVDSDDNLMLRSYALNTVRRGRYQAVNLTNSATVEIRIFRGTLKYETILATLQLVSNLTKYAMTHTPTECKRVKWSDVINVETFKELTNYCSERGIQ